MIISKCVQTVNINNPNTNLTQFVDHFKHKSIAYINTIFVSCLPSGTCSKDLNNHKGLVKRLNKNNIDFVR